MSLSVGELSGGSVSMQCRRDSQQVGGARRGPCWAGLHATWLPLLFGNRSASLKVGSKPAVLSWVLSWVPLSVCILGDAIVYCCSWEGDGPPRSGFRCPTGILQSTTGPWGHPLISRNIVHTHNLGENLAL